MENTEETTQEQVVDQDNGTTEPMDERDMAMLTKKIIIMGSDEPSLLEKYREEYKDKTDIDLLVLDQEQLGLVIYTLSLEEQDKKRRKQQKTKEEELEEFYSKEENKIRATQLAMDISKFSDKRNMGWFKVDDIKKHFKATRLELIHVVKSLIGFEMAIEDEKIEGLYKIVVTNKQKVEFHQFMTKKRQRDLEEVQKAIKIHEESIKAFSIAQQ